MIFTNIINVIIRENDYQLDYECEFNTIVSLNTREFTKIKIDGSLNIDLVSSLANNHFISRILKRNYFTL